MWGKHGRKQGGVEDGHHHYKNGNKGRKERGGLLHSCLPPLRTPLPHSPSRFPSTWVVRRAAFWLTIQHILPVWSHFTMSLNKVNLDSTEHCECEHVCLYTHVYVYVYVLFLLQPAHTMKWLILQHWVRINLNAIMHLNEFENFRHPLDSLPQFLWSTLKNLRPSKHECMYAFMYMNSNTNVKRIESCLLSH